MSMKEKLMEIIQNSVGGCAKHWAEVIADGLIANGVTVQEWSSVDDRLPETVGKYLVCTAKGHDDPVGEEGECGMGIKCESVKNAKAEVAREIFEEIEEEIVAELNSNYRCRTEYYTKQRFVKEEGDFMTW